MIEALAKVQHEIWSHWMQYLFKNSIEHEDGSVTIPAEKVARWKRQMETEFSELSAIEQKSDIDQALKVLRALGQEISIEAPDQH